MGVARDQPRRGCGSLNNKGTLTIVVCGNRGKQFTGSSDVCPSAAGRTDSTYQLAFAFTGTLDKQNQSRRSL
ncbi:hypothetical protein CA54_49780 [Symmachiella macrocystis]|uniref:Uncharacterized protein n=1 Tax=Symmachiella macrocystis TaxID=2527985 RepID=A0A5C6B523_9PLAN|nr:hypothetical protein CA54_49780 [Symmachiella macrocystis]